MMAVKLAVIQDNLYFFLLIYCILVKPLSFMLFVSKNSKYSFFLVLVKGTQCVDTCVSKGDNFSFTYLIFYVLT